MPFVAVIWLALLHALSLAAPLPVRGGAGAGVPERVVQLHDTAPGIAAQRAHAPDDALRAAHRITGVAAARTTGAPPHGGASMPAFAAPASPSFPSQQARETLRRHGNASHAVAARGRLLPYFPTAPPHQG